MEQLSLFPNMLEPWQEQCLKWWDMHGFRPEKGVLAFISDMNANRCSDGSQLYALWVECEIVEVKGDRLVIRPIVGEDSHYKIKPGELWEVDYYGVDPILYK